MNWHEIIKFNEEHIKEFVKNKDFWKRFNELENLLETQEDNLRDYEKVKYITLNEFMLKSVLDEVREFIKEKYKEDYSENDNYVPIENLNLENCSYERSLQVLAILDKVGDK